MTVFVNGVAQGSGAPTDVDYWVSTADGDLSNEMVVTAPLVVWTNSQTTTGSSLAFGTNNDAYYMPIWIPAPMTITKIGYEVVNSAGNMSVGIYDSTGTRLQTSGSYAMEAAGERWKTITSTNLLAGQHYLGVSNSDNTATLRISNGASTLSEGGMVLVASNHPVAASFTPPTVPGSVTDRGIYNMGVA